MKKLKVVLLDDERSTLQLLRIYLGRIKDVEVVAEFEDPLEFIKEEEELIYDLLISDVDMPGTTGIKLARLVRQPIIFVTAKANIYGSELLETSIQSENVLGAIPKPINFDFLVKVIQKVTPKLSTDVSIEKEFIKFKIEGGHVLIKLSDIQLVSTRDFEKNQAKASNSNNKIVYLKNEKPILINTDISLKKIHQQMENHPDFFLVSETCLVHKSAIGGHSKTDVWLRLNIDPIHYAEKKPGCPVQILESTKADFFAFLDQNIRGSSKVVI
jgi:CheY-like chemotaxis protein